MQQDISNCRMFMRGVARFEHITTDAVTGVEAWRRTYPSFAPHLNRVEIIRRQEGKYYPEESKILRRIPANDPALREKVQWYLERGPEQVFPGDEQKSIFNESE